jgi:hypothetical protein
MNEYFLETQERRIGPLSDADLRAYFHSQLLREQDMISGDGLPAPLRARELAELWQIPFRTQTTPASSAPMAELRFHAARAEPVSGGWWLAAVLGVMAVAAWAWLRPAAPEALAATPALAGVAAGVKEQVAQAPADEDKFPPLPATAVPTAAPASAMASALPTSPVADTPTPALPVYAPVPAATRDAWLSTAQEDARCRCWSRLLSHSLDWTRAQSGRGEAWSFLGEAQFRLDHFEEAQART